MGYIYFISEDEYNQYRKRWYKKCSENNIEEDEIFESFLFAYSYAVINALSLELSSEILPCLISSLRLKSYFSDTENLVFFSINHFWTSVFSVLILPLIL